MRRLLQPRLPPTTCVFRDILEIWGNGEQVSQYFAQFPDPGKKLSAAQQLPVWTHGWCLAHEAWCPYHQYRMRVQGPPCTDWSKAGLGQGAYGPMFTTLLASGSKAQLTEPHVCLVENVGQMDDDVFRSCYGPMFSWHRRLQCPADVGFACVARERKRFWETASGDVCPP